jgi:hypothetical protein
MSMQQSGSSTVTYNDHELQQFFFKHELDSTGGGRETSKAIVKEDPTVGGLDRGEVAEIVFMRVHESFHQRTDAGDINGEVSTLISDFQVKVNDVSNVGANGEDVDGNAFEVQASQTDDLGLLYASNQVIGGGFEDDTNGNGGSAGHQPATIYDIDFTDHFGGGPILDRFDEITLQSDIKGQNHVGRMTSEVRVFLYYNVLETDEVDVFGRGMR